MPTSIGVADDRTHARRHAEPMTFGLKLALWCAELARDVERIRRARDVVRSARCPVLLERSAIAADRRSVCRTLRPRAGAGVVPGDSA